MIGTSIFVPFGSCEVENSNGFTLLPTFAIAGVMWPTLNGSCAKVHVLHLIQAQLHCIINAISGNIHLFFIKLLASGCGFVASPFTLETVVLVRNSVCRLNDLALALPHPTFIPVEILSY